MGKPFGLITATEPTSNGPSSDPERISSFHSGQRAGFSQSSQTLAGSAEVSARASVSQTTFSMPIGKQLCPL